MNTLNFLDAKSDSIPRGAHVRERQRDTHGSSRARSLPGRNHVVVVEVGRVSGSSHPAQPWGRREAGHGNGQGAVVGVEPDRRTETQGGETLQELSWLVAGDVPGRLQRLCRLPQLLLACLPVIAFDSAVVEGQLSGAEGRAGGPRRKKTVHSRLELHPAEAGRVNRDRQRKSSQSLGIKGSSHSRNVCRPCGTRSYFPVHPALTRWAKPVS